MPFVRSLLNGTAAWGVSHSRVPTESRPGHIAMIAGFYEDVSAVTKGWKKNPVEFDFFFNHTRRSWAWGSPDILDLFCDNQQLVCQAYDAHFEDFASGTLPNRLICGWRAGGLCEMSGS